MVSFRMFSRTIGIVSTFVLARILNTSDFGIVAIAFTISAALNSVSNVGVTENLIRLKSVGRKELDTGFTIQLIKACITCILLLMAAPLAATWFSEPRLTNVIYVLSAVFALGGVENIGIINFRREMRFDREFQLSAIERVLTFMITILVAVLLKSYWALVIGMLASKIVRVIATYSMESYRPKLGLQAWKELASFSLWMWLSSLVYMIWLRADPLVVGSEVSKTLLGLYVVALDIALLPATEIMEPIGAVLFAGFASEYNAGRDPRTNALNLAVSLMAIMAPVSLVISAASTDIVGVLLGPKWSDAAPIVAILALSVTLSPFSSIAAQSLTASGKIRSNLVVVLIASIIKVGVLYGAARTGNLNTIAISALAITSAETSMFVYMLCRNGSQLSGVGWPLIRIVISLLLSAYALEVTGLAWAGAEVLSLTKSLGRGVVVGAIGVSVYLTAVYCLWKIAGRPNSPERQVFNILFPFLERTYSRGSSLLSRKRVNTEES